MEPGIKPVVLMIADISGYTQFMLANRQALEHSQQIISHLIQAIIQEVEIPLQIAKLEGDAIFLYAVKEEGEQAWEITKHRVGAKLLRFFETFEQKLVELQNGTECTCGACSHIKNLRLKVIIHSGEALFYQLGHFYELAGVDVIIVHRLLKNSVASDQYILLTEAAYQDVDFTGKAQTTLGQEEYSGIGAIKTHIYLWQ